MNDGATGSPPRSGWAGLVCELHVEDLDASLGFWCDLLGFSIAFRRPSEGFAYLEHDEGQQIILCRRNGRFETGEMRRPLGQGVMFQLYRPDIEATLAALQRKEWPLYMAPREVWRRTGSCESGQREFFVQDPDGYLVMIAAPIGERPPTGAN